MGRVHAPLRPRHRTNSTVLEQRGWGAGLVWSREAGVQGWSASEHVWASALAGGGVGSLLGHSDGSAVFS